MNNWRNGVVELVVPGGVIQPGKVHLSAMLHALGRKAVVFLGAFLTILVLASPASAIHDKPHRLLIVYDADSTQAATLEISRGLRRGFEASGPTAFDIYSEYLDSVRFPGQANLDRMFRQILEKYRAGTLDAIIAVGPTAFQFLIDHRSQLAPDVPLFFGAITEETVRAESPAPDIKGVVSKFDVRLTMELARRLRPNGKQAIVLTGSAPFDKSWQRTAKAQLGDHYAGFDISYLSDLSIEEFQNAVKEMKPDETVLLLTVYQDATGTNFVPREAAAIIAPESGAPVYSVYDTFIGAGVLGGYIGPFDDLGRQLAEIVKRQLAGDKTVPQMTALAPRPVVDWREMQRLGIPVNVLPDDTEVRFRTPSLWDEYRTIIVLTTSVILFKTALIVALLFQSYRRKQAEREAATGRLELAHLSRASLLGELSGAFAHELNQPLTSILANAQVGGQLIDSGQASLAELKEILSDIVTDDKRAAQVIVQLRRLLTKGDVTLEPLDLNQIASTTLTLARSELLVKNTRVDFQRPLFEVPVYGNFSQLQQVLLNLVFNAVDATLHLPPQARMIEVAVNRNGKSGELVVTDNGTGLKQEILNDVFKPFVSTKPKGLGLGLSICRSITTAHNGSLSFDPLYTRGARIVLSLPIHGGVS